MPVQTNDQHYGLKTPYKRCPFPSPWRGLAEAELEAASGVAGASLVHQGGYVAYTSTREAALQVSTVQSRTVQYSKIQYSTPYVAYTSTREAALQASSFTSHILGCFGFRGVSSPTLVAF